MRNLILVLGLALTLGGCASNAPQKAWGKPGVSKMDYALDVGVCAGIAATQTGGNGAHNAGGVDGKAIANTANPPVIYTPTPANGSNQSTHVEAPLPANGTYSGMASGDYAQRAASQQRALEMTAQRARAETLKGCLVGRGYQEFTLTAEQSAHLATLTRGTHEYLEYLHSIGSGPVTVADQPTPAK